MLAIDTRDPLAGRVASAADLDALMPTLLPRLRTWLREYKTTDGKPPNVLRGERPLGPAEAADVIATHHASWRELMATRALPRAGGAASARRHGFWLNTSVHARQRARQLHAREQRRGTQRA